MAEDRWRRDASAWLQRNENHWPKEEHIQVAARWICRSRESWGHLHTKPPSQRSLPSRWLPPELRSCDCHPEQGVAAQSSAEALDQPGLWGAVQGPEDQGNRDKVVGLSRQAGRTDEFRTGQEHKDGLWALQQ